MNDLRFAFRQLLKNPGFTALCVFTLGLGIGLVSIQFTLIDGVLLRPLPFPDGERLFHIGRNSDHGNMEPWRPLPVREFLMQREQQSSFEALAGFRAGTFNVSQAGQPSRRLGGSAVTANFFSLLRMAPQVGRAFQPGDDRPGQPLLVVLGDAAWRDAFGGDPGVVGQSLQVNGETATVIGVMPAGFRFPNREECWVNVRLDPEGSPGREPAPLAAMGLIKPGISVASARADLEVIARRYRKEFEPDETRPARMAVLTFPRAHSNGATNTLLGIMLAMTGFVLALACVNVANLQFARAAGRLRELAVRAALGAGQPRLFRQLLVESLALAALGALLGILIAGGGARLLESQVTSRLELSSLVRFDLNIRVVAITAGAAGLAGILAGLLPAFRASRVNLAEALKDDARGSAGGRQGWAARWLVTAQIAVAGGLVVIACLLALSALRNGRVNLAFDPGSILIGRLELRGPAYEEPAARVRFYQRLLEHVRSTPGVAAAAVSSRDLVDPGVYSQFEMEGVTHARPAERPGGWLEVVSRDYFQLVNCGALSGRLFTGADTADSQPVAVVNRSFAEKHWPGADPLGRRIRRAEEGARWATVIGVVPDLNLEGVGNSDAQAGWYFLQDQQAWGWLDLLVRAEGDPATIIAPVRAAVAAVDPAQPIHTIATLGERTARRVAGLEIVSTLAGAFALTAVVLAGVGIYGVLALGVRRRTREFGVRLALGATRREIFALLFRQNAGRTLGGVVAGLAFGYLLALPLASFLPRVSVLDPAIYAAVAALLTTVALIALGVPARRAARVDPMVALRSE